jgi:predicted dinucleotide-binding enzyme
VPTLEESDPHRMFRSAPLFYAADDDAAGDLVTDLIRASGFEPVRVGGLDQSIRIEGFGDLHERHLAAKRSEEVQYATRGLSCGAREG